MNTRFILNGVDRNFECEAGESLKTLLKKYGIVSIRDGCDGEGSCGLCAVLMDGKTVNSCLILAAQAEGHSIATLEYYSKDPLMRIIQRALVDASCIQCG